MADAALDPWAPASDASAESPAIDPWGAPGQQQQDSQYLPLIDRLEASGDAAAAWNKAHPDDQRTADTITSPAGAVGRYQVTPATARTYGLDPTKLSDPAYNRMAANVILSDLSQRYKDDRDAVAVAWNAGPAVADRWLKAGRNNTALPQETRSYLARARDPWAPAAEQGSSAPSQSTEQFVAEHGYAPVPPPSGPAPSSTPDNGPGLFQELGQEIAQPWRDNPIWQGTPEEMASIQKLPQWARPYAYDLMVAGKAATNVMQSGMSVLPVSAIHAAEAAGFKREQAERLARDVNVAQQMAVTEGLHGVPEAREAPATAEIPSSPERAPPPQTQPVTTPEARRAEILRQIGISRPQPEPAAPEVMPAAPGLQAASTGIQGRPVGADVAITAAGREVPVRYAVVDARDLVPSQTEMGAINPAYPQELQPRDRTRAVSQNQVAQIAQNLNPRLLDRTTSAGDGAPIISPGGIVESGNGRTLAIQRAYREGMPSAAAYRDYLAAQGYPVQGIENPVLVRVREGEMTPEDRQAFVREANQPAQLAYSATEQAMTDAAALPDTALDLYRGGDVENAGNRDFVRAFLRSAVPETEQARMVDKDGALSQDAIRRIRNGLFAKAYGDPDLTSLIAESPDSNIKAIGGALTDVAPEWAKMRSAAARGAIPPEMDQTNAMLEAARLVAKARAQGQKLGDLVNQTGMFSGRAVDPDVEGWLELMFRDTRDWTGPVGREKLADALKHYAVEAQKIQPGPDLMGNVPVSPAELKQATRAKQERSYAGGQQQRLAEEAPSFAGTSAGPHGGTGAGSGTEGAPAPQGAGAAETSSQGLTEGPVGRSPFGAIPPDWTTRDFETVSPGRKTSLTDELSRYLRRGGADQFSGRQALSAIASYIHTRGVTTGHESLGAWNHRNGDVLANTSGDRKFVPFSPEMERMLRDPNNRIVSTHNHPTSGSFSGADLAALAHQGHAWMTVTGHDGSWYAARLSPALKDRFDWKPEVVADVSQGLAKALTAAQRVLYPIWDDQVREGRLDATAAAHMLWDATTRAVERAGIIDYMSTRAKPAGYPSLAGRLEDAAKAAAGSFDRATGTAAGSGLYGRRRAAETTHSWPEPVRFSDGIARILGELGEAPAGSVGGERNAQGVRGAPQEGYRKPEQLRLLNQTLDTPKVPEPAALGEEEVPYADVGGALPPGGGEPPEPPAPPPSGGGLGGWLTGKFSRAAPDTAGHVRTIWHDAKMLVSPMTAGPRYAQATSKDFANAMRLARDMAARNDKMLTKEFTPDERRKMWLAGDEQSIAEQRGEATQGIGLDRLEPKERLALEALQAENVAVFKAAKDLGMVRGDGLPSYMPHLAAEITSTGAKRIGGESTRSIPGIGRNLRTSIPQLRGRKYETAEEMEQALSRSTGKNVSAIRDVRVLPYVTGRLREAVAGRAYINAIRDFGRSMGDEMVSEGANPGGGWFTLNHPSFFTWRPKFVTDGETGKTVPAVDQNGDTVFEKVPLYIHPDWEGPAKAVLSQDEGALYRATMAMKAKALNNIMFSPLVQLHLLTEIGRALPAAPLRVATGKIMFDGYRAKMDPFVRDEAIMHGMVPIGHRGAIQDITSMTEADTIKPGRSWTAKIVGAVPGLFDRATGARTQDAVYRAVDAAGNFLHNTLLWDRVADLQFGLYTTLRDYAQRKGMSPEAAKYLAAHWANRYAGALPQEAMSSIARKIANVMLFSRSYTMGNWGVFKDMANGLPQDVRAQLERDVGTAEANRAISLGKRKAIGIVALDVALMYAGNSLLQNFFAYQSGRQDTDQIVKGYIDRWHSLEKMAQAKPLAVLNPFDDMGRLSATAENEIDPATGRPLNRILIGYQKDGTATYARNPLGKFGEEANNWTEAPGPTLLSKLSNFAHPTYNVIANDKGFKGFGRHVYNSSDSTMQTAAKIIGQYMQAQLPMDQIEAGKDLLLGKTKALDAEKMIGRTIGVTFRKGAPGGPAVGELFRLREQQQQERDAAMPAIIEKIKDRDFAGARADMRKLGIPAGLQNYYIRTTINPQLRMSTKAARKLLQMAPQEERDRILRMQEQNR